MMVAKSVSIELEDLIKITVKIKNGEAANLSDFVRIAIKNELNGGKDEQFNNK